MTNVASPQHAGTAPTSSPGEHPVSPTPKDIEAEHASARDLHARDMRSSDIDTLLEALLDEAVEESFPASDPVAISTRDELQQRLNVLQQHAALPRRN